jgi:hypothetical protein
MKKKATKEQRRESDGDVKNAEQFKKRDLSKIGSSILDELRKATSKEKESRKNERES